MKTPGIAQRTEARLRQYSVNASEPFTDEVIGEVADLAERHAAYSDYRDFIADAGVQVEPYTPDGYKPQAVIDVLPDDCDPRSVLLRHMPMGGALDSNQEFQTANIATLLPDRHVLTIGNPSGPGRKAGIMTVGQVVRTAKGDHAPTIDPVRKYLDDIGAENVDHDAFSRGTLTMVDMLNAGDTPSQLAIAKEMVLGRRNPAKLLIDFASTGGPLDGYVNATGLDIFKDARAESDGLVLYTVGLGRLTNLAIGLTLCAGDYHIRAAEALRKHPETDLTNAWGSQSELATDAHARAMQASLEKEFGSDRVHTQRLVGEKHNFVNDLYIDAAITLQAVRRQSAGEQPAK